MDQIRQKHLYYPSKYNTLRKFRGTKNIQKQENISQQEAEKLNNNNYSK